MNNLQWFLAKRLAIYYSVVLVFICISLALAYGSSSLAWEVDFGWAVERLPDERPNIRLGWLIELMRCVVIIAGSIIFMCGAVPKSVLALIGMVKTPKKRRWWLQACRYLILVGLIVGLIFVIWHNLFHGPTKLAEGGRLWADYKEKFPPSYEHVSDFHMYVYPYRCYCLYSLMIYLFVAIPFLGVSLYAAGVEFVYGIRLMKTFSRSVSKSTSCNELKIAFARGCHELAKAIQRYCMLAMGLAMLFTFEYLWGRFTLSVDALIWAYASYAIAAIGLLIVGAQLFHYVQVAQNARLRAIELEVHKQENQHVAEYLDQSQNVRGFYLRILKSNPYFYVAAFFLTFTPAGTMVDKLNLLS